MIVFGWIQAPRSRVGFSVKNYVEVSPHLYSMSGPSTSKTLSVGPSEESISQRKRKKNESYVYTTDLEIVGRTLELVDMVGVCRMEV